MDELIEFLLARLDEDEAVARKSHEWWDSDLTAGYFEWPSSESHNHVLRHDPARVLVEVAAKRRIVLLGGKSDADAVEGGGGPYDVVDWRYGIHAAAHQVVLRLLALPYANHPDYREEWRP